MIDQWILPPDAIPILDEASVAVARERVRHDGRKLGLPDVVIANLAIVVSELAHNQLFHGRGGMIATNGTTRDGVPGLEVVAADRGDGIRDPEKALRGNGSTGQGLGIGLAGVRELSDEIDVDVRLDEGTCVWARKFAEPVRRRREVGTFGRPIRSERISGDHAMFLRLDGVLVLAMADGLGHGRGAREAAHRAVLAVMQDPEHPVEDVILQSHETLRSTRGAAMSAVRIDEPGGNAEIAGGGNVATCVVGPGVLDRYTGTSAALGTSGRPIKPRVTRTHLRTWDALVQFTDGLSSRTKLDGDGSLLREHPIIIAQHLLQTFGSHQDDALVQVAR